jgi:hypothetical protein
LRRIGGPWVPILYRPLILLNEASLARRKKSGRVALAAGAAHTDEPREWQLGPRSISKLL